jgi:hypothetical protein
MQQLRLAQQVKNLWQNREAHFDTRGMQDSIYAMRVNDSRDGTIFFASPDRCYLSVEQIRDKTDAEIQTLLREWQRSFESNKHP